MAKMVRYMGTAHIRQITAMEWQKVGVNDMETVVWHKANNWTVPASKFSDEAWPFIEADEKLVVTGEDTPLSTDK